MSNARTFFYAAVGERLTAHGVDVDRAQLRRGETVSLGAWVQYAWPHPERPILYVVSSNGGPTSGDGDTHHASAFDITPETGALTQRGARVELARRPIHCSVDGQGNFLLIAYNRPSGLSVHQLAIDGSLADEVAQDVDLDFGIYAHQVRVSPSDRSVGWSRAEMTCSPVPLAPTLEPRNLVP